MQSSLRNTSYLDHAAMEQVCCCIVRSLTHVRLPDVTPANMAQGSLVRDLWLIQSD